MYLQKVISILKPKVTDKRAGSGSGSVVWFLNFLALFLGFQSFLGCLPVLLGLSRFLRSPNFLGLLRLLEFLSVLGWSLFNWVFMGFLGFPFPQVVFFRFMWFPCFLGLSARLLRWVRYRLGGFIWVPLVALFIRIGPWIVELLGLPGLDG